jgi:DNA helicase-2/ATP-dependent DNA helicase PcrA
METHPGVEWTRLERDLLAGCDPDQVEAITTVATPLCVLAGAGSGKTRVLTRRIAWRVMSGSATSARVLALTFTRKAAGELRTRLGELGLPEAVTAGTFHGVALAELKRLAAEQGRRPPVVLGSKVRILLDVLDDGPVLAARRSPGPELSRTRSGRRPAAPQHSGPPGRAVADLASEIEWAKSRCLSPDEMPRAAAFAGRRSSWDPEEVVEIWKHYEIHKRRRGVLDFEDLLARCTEHLLADHEFAASARWRFRHLFVDEYQDINEAQQRLLRAWLGTNDDLCVVGDPHQAIYSWNGSNPRAITEFREDFDGATVLRLSTNYRSTPEVLTVAGAVLGESIPVPVGGAHPEGPVPTIQSYDDEASEATGVAEAIRRARPPGRSWSQIAVLARTNAQLDRIREALVARNVPFRVAAASDLLRQPSIQAALREVTHAPDAAAISAWAADLRVISLEPVNDAEPDGEPGEPAPELGELARLAGEYLAEDVRANGTGFKNWLDTTWRREGGPSRQEAVELTTFHRAKGLEWAVVFIVGLEDGFVPIAHARDSDALAEERRLLYVACTRAEEELHCSWAAERTFASRPIPRSPSPWIAAIEAAHRDLERLRRPSPDAARDALAESRRLLAGGATEGTAGGAEAGPGT